jgi:hypothetical protein
MLQERRLENTKSECLRKEGSKIQKGMLEKRRFENTKRDA